MHIKCLTQFLAPNRYSRNQSGDKAEEKDGKMVGVMALLLTMCLSMGMHMRMCDIEVCVSGN